MAFSSIPVLDLSLSRDPETKAEFLVELRRALLEVGFLYIKNTGIDFALIQDVIKNGKAFFDLPTEAKLAVQMKNAKSFLGVQPIDVGKNTVMLTSQATMYLAEKSPRIGRIGGNK